MNSSRIDSTGIGSSESPSVYFCPSKTVYTWILDETTAFYATITTKSIAVPITIVLNILVIVAVNKRRELQKNSNILLASMAVADLVVGAVSMPLTITTDVLLVRKDLSLTICKLAFANQIVLYAAVSSSFYHLTVIAFERYVAIKRWKSYKAIVTKARVKMSAVMAWLLAVVSTAPVRIMTAAEVDDKYIKILNILSAIKTVVCVVLIGYCYITAYLSLRSRKGNEISQVAARSKAKLENTIAKATGILTTVLFVSYIPSVLVLLLGGSIPLLRTSSFFRWSELLVQLNSLLNPILYCFALNRNLRNEVLEMLKIRRPEPVQPAARPHLSAAVERRARRIGGTEFVEEVQEVHQEEQRPARKNGGISSDSIKMAEAVSQMPQITNNQPTVKRSMSCRARVIGKTEPQEFQKERQQRGRNNRAMSWDSMELSDGASKLPYSVSSLVEKEMPSSSCEENQVIYVDVHQPNPNKSTPRIQVTGVSTEESQSEIEDRSDPSLPNSKSHEQPMAECPLPPSSSEENRSICVDVRGPIFSRGKPRSSLRSWHGIGSCELSENSELLRREDIQGSYRPATR